MLGAHGVDRSFVDGELSAMAEHRVAPTANRSVLGVMADLARFAVMYLSEDDDVVAASLRLARIPCGPLYKRRITPAGELAALVAGGSGRMLRPDT